MTKFEQLLNRLDDSINTYHACEGEPKWCQLKQAELILLGELLMFVKMRDLDKATEQLNKLENLE